MRRAMGVIGIAAFCLPCLMAQEAPKTCRPTTAIDSQERHTMKHRPSGPANGTQSTVPDMLAWGFPANIDSKATRSSQEAIDNKETQVFTLTGNLWRIGLEGNDCDIHMELSDVSGDKASQRVIAEIPQENEQARTQVLDLLGAADRQKILNEQPDEKGNYRFINLTHQVEIRVTGYAFYDATHYSRNWKASKGGNCHFTPEEVHQRGNSHGTCAVGTLWELHPVWSVQKP
ncbi:MAG: hypothetical protein ABSB82_17025 [Terriglobia bacterium]